LDIGAGGGEFVCLANWSGYEAIGIEPNLGYSQFAREHYSVTVQTAELSEIEHHRADCVSMFHVLEHIPDPLEVMARLYEIVNPGGFLFIEVPNIEQADASPSNIFFSAHLYYFSSPTLISAASKYFMPVYIETTGNLRAIFRRRESPARLVLPSAVDVGLTLERLRRKGWLEYLTVGGGYKKPVKRMYQYWKECRVRNKTPIQIIRQVAMTSTLKQET
jgi:SAM-dependent methyltransferase